MQYGGITQTNSCLLVVLNTFQVDKTTELSNSSDWSYWSSSDYTERLEMHTPK